MSNEGTKEHVTPHKSECIRIQIHDKNWFPYLESKHIMLLGYVTSLALLFDVMFCCLNNLNIHLNIHACVYYTYTRICCGER